MHILIYLSSRIVLCMLIKMMLSSVLHGKSKSKFSFFLSLSWYNHVSPSISSIQVYTFCLEWLLVWTGYLLMLLNMYLLNTLGLKNGISTMIWYLEYILSLLILSFFLVYPTFHFFNIYKPIFFLSSMIACVFYGCWEGVSV